MCGSPSSREPISVGCNSREIGIPCFKPDLHAGKLAFGQLSGQSIFRTTCPCYHRIGLQTACAGGGRHNRVRNPDDFGGEGEIRTPETLTGLPVFKTGAFNRSATSPFSWNQRVTLILSGCGARFGHRCLHFVSTLRHEVRQSIAHAVPLLRDCVRVDRERDVRVRVAERLCSPSPCRSRLPAARSRRNAAGHGASPDATLPAGTLRAS